MQPTNREPTITGDILKVYRKYLANFQVDTDDIYRRAGFDQLTNAETGAKLPLNAISGLLELAAQEANEPAMGLRFALDGEAGYFGMLDHLLLSAPTIRHALAAMENFIELTVAPARVRLRVSGQSAVITVRLPRLLSAPSQQFVDVFAATLVQRIRPADDRDWRPEQVNLPRYQPQSTKLYKNIFGSGVSFEANALRFVLARSDLDLAQPEYCLGLHESVVIAAQSLVRQDGRRLDFTEIVADAVRDRLLANRRVQLTSIAREHSISPRTLQWKLATLGTSFEDVLGGVRVDLATSMLRDTSLPLGEIGLRIGLSEGSAFTRWSKQHFDMAPSAYRKSLRGQI